MIIEVKETNYKGILIEKAEDKGWKCNLGGQVYQFPTFVDAQATVDEIFQNIKPIIVKNKGRKI